MLVREARSASSWPALKRIVACPWRVAWSLCWPRGVALNGALLSAPTAGPAIVAFARTRMERRIAPGPGQVHPFIGSCLLTLMPRKESVWDYPRPPRTEGTTKRIQIVFNGVTVADTTQGLVVPLCCVVCLTTFLAVRVLETSHPPVYYIPQKGAKKNNRTHIIFCWLRV